MSRLVPYSQGVCRRVAVVLMLGRDNSCGGNQALILEAGVTLVDFIDRKCSIMHEMSDEGCVDFADHDSFPVPRTGTTGGPRGVLRQGAGWDRVDLPFPGLWWYR